MRSTRQIVTEPAPGLRTWEGRFASAAGSLLMLAGAVSILLGRAGAPTAVLLIVSAPLLYAGLGLPMPSIQAAGVRLRFKPPGRRH